MGIRRLLEYTRQVGEQILEDRELRGTRMVGLGRRALGAAGTCALVLLASCSGGGSGGDAAPPTVTLTANPTSLEAGSSAQLTWSSTHATRCTASGGWSGNLATSGAVASEALS